MDIILLEKVDNLGDMGDQVNVKDGYARNYLLPRKMALRATESNVAYFDKKRDELKALNEKKKQQAEQIAEKLEGATARIIRQAADSGRLYGSVSSRDIARAVSTDDVKIDRNQVVMERAYKTLGLYPIEIKLHAEVSVEVTVNIARSEEEAEIQEERGVALVATEGEALSAAEEEETAEEEAYIPEDIKEKMEEAEEQLAAAEQAEVDTDVAAEEAYAEEIPAEQVNVETREADEGVTTEAELAEAAEEDKKEAKEG